MNLIKDIDQLSKEIQDLKEKVLYFINKVKDYDDEKDWNTETKIDTESYFIKRFENLKLKISVIIDELDKIDSSVKKLSDADVFNEEIFRKFLMKDIYTKWAYNSETIIDYANKINFDIKRNIKLLSQQYKVVENVTTIEWDKIASTLTHTLKGASNIILRKSQLLLEGLDAKNKGTLLSIIAEAEYTYKIIKLFDIIRLKTTIETEIVDLRTIIALISDSENRCFELAEFSESKLSIESLERIAGKKYPKDREGREVFKKDISLIKNNYEKDLYDLKLKVNKVALSAIFDELILNMYRYSKKKNSATMKDLDGSVVDKHIDEKPDVFELEIKREGDELIFRFSNSADSKISDFSKILKSKDFEGSLPNQSFGLHFMNMFSTDSPSKNLQFYKMRIPPNKEFSEIIFSFIIQR